jgi:hypothetical protein
MGKLRDGVSYNEDGDSKMKVVIEWVVQDPET